MKKLKLSVELKKFSTRIRAKEQQKEMVYKIYGKPNCKLVKEKIKKHSVDLLFEITTYK